MKKIIVLMTLVISVFVVQGQNDYKREQAVFELALQFNDVSSAKKAVYEMMILKPENQLGLLDTLSMLFFTDSDFQNCVKTTSLLIKKNPKKFGLYEMRAKSLQRLGYTKESLTDFEVLYSNTQQEVFLYEILVSQFGLKRYGEAEQSANTLLVSTNDTLKVDVPVMKGKYQSVLMKAAVYNVKGVIALEVGQKDTAKSLFEKALAIEPQFLLASNNLKLISSKEEEGNEGKEKEEVSKKKKR